MYWVLYRHKKKFPNCLPKWLYYFAFLLEMNEGFFQVPSSPASDVLSFLILASLVVMSYHHHITILIYNFLVTRQLISFHTLISLMHIFLQDMYVHRFGPFFIWVIFLLFSCKRCLYIFGYKSLIRQASCKQLNPVCGLLFHYRNNVFSREEVFNFNKIQLNFSFIDCAFSAVSINSLLNSRLFTFGSLIFYLSTVLHFNFSSLQLFIRVQLFMTPWTAACQASLSIANSWSLLKLMTIKSVMLSIHLILCHPLLLLPSIFPSIGVFSSESVLRIRWSKYRNFSFSISPSNEYSGFPLGLTGLSSLLSKGLS